MNDGTHRCPCLDAREPGAGTPAELRVHGRAPGGGARDRRGFLFGVGAALMAVGGALVAVPVIGTLFAPARRRDPDRWTDLGPVDGFPSGTTRLATFTNPESSPTDGDSARDACWVRSLGDGRFQVFAVNCAHLGCPVRWFEQSRLFMCPCHGGVYYEDGSRASGPPPRGLFEYRWRVEAGRLQIEAGRLPGLQEGT